MRVCSGREVEEQRQYRHHQGVPLFQRHRRQRRVVGRATRQAERQIGTILDQQGRQPQVMGVFEHRQGLAAVELDGELGRQLMKTRLTLQAGENLRGQRTSIDQHPCIDTGAGAEHQVAHIVSTADPGHIRFCRSGVRRPDKLAPTPAPFSRRPETSGQQTIDQRLMLRADPANLQIGPVGRLDHPAGITLGGLGHRAGLIGTDHPAGQLDPADAAIERRDDTQQPRTGRGADSVGKRVFVQGITDSQGKCSLSSKGVSPSKARYYACFVRRHEKTAGRNSCVSRILDGALADSSGNR